MFEFDNQLEKKVLNFWNRKIKYIGIIGGISSTLMIIGAVLLIVFPIASINILGRIIGYIFLVSSIYQLIDYLWTPVAIRYPGNIMVIVSFFIISFLLLSLPLALTISTISWLLALVLLIYGINKQIYLHSLENYGFENPPRFSLSGILSIIFGLIFFISPMLLTLIINYALALFLLCGGIVTLIEVIEIKKFKL